MAKELEENGLPRSPLDKLPCETYSVRLWLNKGESPSTGSVVAYSGISPWGTDKNPEHSTFLEISDCRGSVRIHQSNIETQREYIDKLMLLSKNIDDFAIWLEIQHAKSL